MPEKKDDMHRISPEEFFQELEAADVYLPVQTETTSVSPESRVVVYSSPRSAGADRFRLLQMHLPEPPGFASTQGSSGNQSVTGRRQDDCCPQSRHSADREGKAAGAATGERRLSAHSGEEAQSEAVDGAYGLF